MITSTNRTTLRIHSRYAAVVNVAAMLGFMLFSLGASAQTPPSGLPDRGILRLQLGTAISDGTLHSPRRFVHEPSGLSQSINSSGKCGMTLGGPNALAVLTASGGRGILGLGPDSIGVQDGGSGVSCYRLTASINEQIKFGLGADVSALAVIDANAFYRLELDMEVKKDAEFLLQILTGGAVTGEFRLRTGSSILAGEGSTEPGSADKILNCMAQSDSGPDAGSRDNCRWTVNALGQEFRLIPIRGEGSLEGGGDFGTAAYANNTLVYLTKGAIGALGCNSTNVPQGTGTVTIGDGNTTAQCAVTRVDPTTVGGSCTTAIGYVLRNIGGTEEGCEFIKTPGEQLAASITILFPPEDATALGSELLTLIKFSTGQPAPNDFQSFVPQRCIGMVVPDRNGEPTIAEVLDPSMPTFVPDIVPGGHKDWACILNNTQEYVGSDLMQVRQTILFWGDIEYSRKAK